MKKFFWLSLSLLILLSCNQADDTPNQVNDLADSYIEEYFTTYPELAVLTGAPDLRPAELSNNSLAALEKWHTKQDSMLKQLNAIDASLLDGKTEAVTYGFLKNQLESTIAMRGCNIELWNVSPTFTGWQNTLSFVASSLPVKTQKQREDAYSRLSQLPDYILTEIDNLKEGVEQGYTAPKSGVKAVLGQIEALLNARVGDSPFASIAPDDAPEFRQQLETLVEMEIRPAIVQYRDYLRDEYLPAARSEVGVSANPNGAACYRAATRYYITTDIPPKEIHQLGLEQMKLIKNQMSAIGERSFGTSDPDEVLRIVKTDPEYRFESREEIVSYAEEAVERAEAELPNWFGFVPDLPVKVEPYPSFQEKSAPLGQAIPPAADGSQPGKYIINAYQPKTQSKAGFESLSFHEAHPGHLFQIYVALEKEGLHPISSYFFLSGFGEGWALYSERLAEEMDLYSSDVSRVGWLASEAHRAARLVVDSGMHALGWTRQESIDYLVANTTLTQNQAEAETDRYIAVPGQATSYMVGALEIRKLRNEAEDAMGDAFDIKTFHDLVLEDGTIPLVMLRDKVERWIDKSE
jgi:uncharacterized protein (DUF885 family)